MHFMFSFLSLFSCSSAPNPSESAKDVFDTTKVDVEIWYSGPLDGEIEPCG